MEIWIMRRKILFDFIETQGIIPPSASGHPARTIRAGSLWNKREKPSHSKKFKSHLQDGFPKSVSYNLQIPIQKNNL